MKTHMTSQEAAHNAAIATHNAAMTNQEAAHNTAIAAHNSAMTNQEASEIKLEAKVDLMKELH